MSALDEKGARAAVETMAAAMVDRIFMGGVWGGIWFGTGLLLFSVEFTIRLVLKDLFSK